WGAWPCRLHYITYILYNLSSSAAEPRPPSRPNTQEALMAQKLFIGGLAFSTSTERLREVFAAAGQVESAAVVTDRDTGRSRGFGFVEMATAEEADQAIAQFNGKDLDGRQLRVEKASAGGARGGGGGNSRGFGGSSRGGRW